MKEISTNHFSQIRSQKLCISYVNILDKMNKMKIIFFYISTFNAKIIVNLYLNLNKVLFFLSENNAANVVDNLTTL